VDLGVGSTTPHTAMTARSLSSALREVLDPAVVIRARTLAEQVGWDGAEIAARRLESEFGVAEN
jgi:hypothetical protein